jgi:hypothetical protein
MANQCILSGLAAGAEKKGVAKGIAWHTRNMLTPIRGLLLCLLAGIATSWFRPVQAAEIFKCATGDGPVYTDEPVSDSCRKLRFTVSKPDPEAIARLEQWKEQRAAEEARKAAEAREERLVRARELEALAAWQSSRAARMEAEAAQYSRYPQEVYYPIRGYSIGSPYFRDYSRFDRRRYPSYGYDARRDMRYGMPPAQLHFSRKRR